MFSRRKGQVPPQGPRSPGQVVRSPGHCGTRQEQMPVGRSRQVQAEGLPSFLYWGRGYIVPVDLCAGPHVRPGLRRHRRRPELWWAGEVTLFHKRVSESDLFRRIGGI